MLRARASPRRLAALILLALPRASVAAADSFFGSFFRGKGAGQPFGGDGGGGAGAAVDSSGYYKTLGVDNGVSEVDLKRAYRKLALQHHPDKSGGSPAMFKKIAEAFSVLSDPQKRQAYDQHGKAGVQRAASGGGGGAGGPSADDLFSMFFGGGGGRGAPEEAEDTAVALDLTLEEMYSGREKTLRLQRTRVCGSCSGTGGKGGREGAVCAGCDGQGVVVRLRQLGGRMVQQLRMRCPECSGEGRVLAPADVCANCDGRRIVLETATLAVTIEPGVAQGEQIVLRGEGNEQPGLRTGDLLLVVRERPHALFQRQGDDLISRMSVSLREALVGFELPLRRLDGRTLRLRVPRGRLTKPASIKRVAGEGMPRRGGGHGDLYVRMEVELPSPQTLGEEKLAELERLLVDVECAARLPGGEAGPAADDEDAIVRELEDVQ